MGRRATGSLDDRPRAKIGDRRHLGKTAMNRRSILTCSAIATLGLALLPSSIIAQQGSLRLQLVGTWTLVLAEVTTPNGTKLQPFGTNPKGTLIFDANGQYATVFGQSVRPKFNDPDQPTTEERAAAQASFAANYGTWSVNEADKTLTVKFEGALVPNNEGNEVEWRPVSLSGDELKLSRPGAASGSRVEFVYRRPR
jgi:hypothetical protein